MALAAVPKARSASRQKLDADLRLLKRVERMLSRAYLDVQAGELLVNGERNALEGAARQMAQHGRDR